MMKILTTFFLIITSVIILIGGGVQAMPIFGGEFQNKYTEFFQDIEKLNTYTRTHKVELSSVTVKDVNIRAAEFHGAVFKNVKWENMTMEDSIFNDVVFENCEFEDVNFNAGTFVNCEFINCQFNETKMNRAVFTGGKFLGCDIKNSGMVKWTGDGVEFSKSTVLDTPLAQGNISFTFRETDLDGVRIMMTEGLHPLLIEGGTLSEVDFGKSYFSTVTLRRVKQGEGGVKFNSVTAESISFEDVEMMRGTGIGYSTVGMVRIVGGKMYGPSFLDANIAKTYVRDAYVTRFAIGSKMGQVSINNTTLHRTGLFDGYVDELNITNSTLDEIVGENFKADIVVWDNVTLDGKVDLTNAHINDFRPTRIKRGPKLNLMTTGSNIKF